MEPDRDAAGAGDGSEPVGDRVRIYRRGRTWYANFQFNGRQRRITLKTSSKKEARRRAIQIEAELADGRWKQSKPAASVESGIDDYRSFLQVEGRAPKTLAKYETVFARVRNLAARRKTKDLSGIDLSFVDAYRQERAADGAAPKTRYTESVVIRQLVNFALSRDMLAADPLKGLRLKKPKASPQPCWTHEQVQQILNSSPDEAGAAFTLLAETGLRIGELIWLTWDDIDLGQNILHVRPKDGWRPKSGDQRAVPLSPRTREVLGSLSRRFRWVLTAPPTARRPERGQQVTERRMLALLKRVLKHLDLPGHLHTFRHTFISNALLKGIAIAVVREWVGHVDAEVIKLYTHVHDTASQAAMQRLAEANTNLLQKKENVDHGPEDESAHNQHKPKES